MELIGEWIDTTPRKPPTAEKFTNGEVNSNLYWMAAKEIVDFLARLAPGVITVTRWGAQGQGIPTIVASNVAKDVFGDVAAVSYEIECNVGGKIQTVNAGQTYETLLNSPEAHDKRIAQVLMNLFGQDPVSGIGRISEDQALELNPTLAQARTTAAAVMIRDAGLWLIKPR